MTDSIFLKILDMSLTAGIAVIFVIAARLLLKRAPKIFSYAAWSVVLFRLICPFSFESAIGLIPSGVRPSENPGFIVAASTAGAQIQNITQLTVPSDITVKLSWVTIGKYIWIFGILLLAVYSIASIIRLKKNISTAENITDNIYLSNKIETPFVFGILSPGIYMPSSLSEDEMNYIILHEQTHIKRFDHIIKLLSFFTLCIHWFNPLMWTAFFLSAKDMEMSCDEAVIKKLGNGAKKEYSSLLLALTGGRKVIGGVPLSFCEGDTKMRIKNVLRYRKQPLKVIVISSVLVISLCACLIPDRKDIPSSDMVVADGYTVLSNGTAAKVELILTDWIYGTDEDMAVGGGYSTDNYVGNGELRVYINGNMVSSYAIGRLLFNSPYFKIEFSDYNEDKNPDFSIKQWGSSSIDLYTLYTVDMYGQVHALSETDGIASSERSSQSSYSTVFKHYDKTIQTYIYNNAAGKNQEAVYVYDNETGIFISTEERAVNIVTEEENPIGCEYGRTQELDTLEMLEALESINGFTFNQSEAEHLYIQLQFPGEAPKDIYLRYITDNNWQSEYPIDSADYNIKVPDKIGIYNFFADITWNDGTQETIFFDITVK